MAFAIAPGPLHLQRRALLRSSAQTSGLSAPLRVRATGFWSFANRSTVRRSIGAARGLGFFVVAAGIASKRRGRQMAHSRWAQPPADEVYDEVADTYVLVSVVDARWVGKHGVILRLRRRESEVQYSLLGIPDNFPIILDIEQTEAFRQALRAAPSLSPIVGGDPSDAPVVREVHLRYHEADGIRGEVVTEEAMTTGFEASAKDIMGAMLYKHPLSEGAAFGMAKDLSMPLSLSMRALLRRSAACVDRLRLESMVRGKSAPGSEPELAILSEQLVAASNSDLSEGNVGALMAKLDQLATYWCQHQDDGAFAP